MPVLPQTGPLVDAQRPVSLFIETQLKATALHYWPLVGVCMYMQHICLYGVTLVPSVMFATSIRSSKPCLCVAEYGCGVGMLAETCCLPWMSWAQRVFSATFTLCSANFSNIGPCQGSRGCRLCYLSKVNQPVNLDRRTHGGDESSFQSSTAG